MSCALPNLVLDPLVCRWWRFVAPLLIDLRSDVGEVEVTAVTSSSSRLEKGIFN